MARTIQIVTLLLSLYVSISKCNFPTSLVVNTNSGAVRGSEKKTVWNSVPYRAFQGIPYAEPPVGKLRFKSPVPKEPWAGVLDARREGSCCPQVDFFSGNYMGYEDCLFMNVYTTGYGPGVKPKPVLVWIYGGAYFAGYSNSSLYGPDFFLEEDIVFVSFNYRVGVLGFLALDRSDALGNQGMKDQLLALQWVQDNIAEFGGDPNTVTIQGESAGASSIGYHLLSKKSTGLFHRAIMESGTPLCQWAYQTPDKAHQNARDIAGILGFNGFTTTGLLEFLRRVSVKDLSVATLKVDYGFVPYRPTIEDPDTSQDNSTYLTKCPIEIYNSGDFIKMPILMGFNKDEALFFWNYYLGHPDHAENIAKMLRSTSGMGEGLSNVIGALQAAWFNMVPDTLTEANLDLFSGIFFIGPTDLTHRLIAKANGGHPIYYYHLSYMSQWNVHSLVGESVNGTAHVDDVGYLFNVKALKAPTDPNHFFNVFRKKMVSLWANFVKYGNPTPPHTVGSMFEVAWEDSVPSGRMLDINENLSMRDRMVDKITLSFEEQFESTLPYETACANKNSPWGIMNMLFK